MRKQLVAPTCVILLLLVFLGVPFLAPPGSDPAIVGFIGAGVVALPAAILVAVKGNGKVDAVQKRGRTVGLGFGTFICLVVAGMGLAGRNGAATSIGFWLAVWGIALIIAIQRSTPK